MKALYAVSMSLVEMKRQAEAKHASKRSSLPGGGKDIPSAAWSYLKEFSISGRLDLMSNFRNYDHVLDSGVSITREKMFSWTNAPQSAQYYVLGRGKNSSKKPVSYVLYVGDHEIFGNDGYSPDCLNRTDDVVFISGTYGYFSNSRYSPFCQSDPGYIVTDPYGAYLKVKDSWCQDVRNDIGLGLSEIYEHCCQDKDSADEQEDFFQSVAAMIWKNSRISPNFRKDFVTEVADDFFCKAY